MSKNNKIPAQSEKHKAPEHHRSMPLPLHYDFKPQAGHCYCPKCGAISFQKHWYIDSKQEQNLRRDSHASAILCPGCTRVAAQQFEGEVVLANAKFAALAGEIIALIKHIEGSCWHHNPIAKIAAFADEEEIIHIQTTTRWLAERLGKELHKAFKGHVQTKRSPGDKFARIYWTD